MLNKQNGWMDREMDGWKDGCVEESMEREMMDNGWMER